VAEFPASPVSPSEFLEGYVAKALGERQLPDSLRDLDLALGLRLEGEGGGEWLCTLANGGFAIVPGSREAAVLTVIQSVEDWRGALWEGRGGVVSERARRLFQSSNVARLADDVPAPSAESIRKLAELGGTLRAVVTGEPAGEWSAAFKFGPGAIPAEPTTTVSIDHRDVAALANRELAPLEAFLAGRINIAGDMVLLIQLQAIASEAVGAARSGNRE
jgi:putative sterol carrier protein